MSGHSKWATTKRAKAVSDSARGKLFTKLSNLITVAAKQGGGDPGANPTLRFLIEKARENDVPNDNITRAIKRGTGELAGAAVEEITYDAVGPEGAAIIIETITDNKNRTIGDLRPLLQKYGAKLAEGSSQRWQFTRKGIFTVTVAAAERENAELAAIDAGADDVRENDEGLDVFTAPNQVSAVKAALEKKFTVGPVGFEYVPQNRMTFSSDELKKTMADLLVELDERDDVQSVATNF